MGLHPFFDQWLPLYGTGHGVAFQMSAAYSAMVRSLENFPEPATFKIALRAHPVRVAVELRPTAGRPQGMT